MTWLRFPNYDIASSLRFYLPTLALTAAPALWHAAVAAIRRGVVLLLVVGDTARRAAGVLEPLSADSGAASTRARAGEWIDANIPAGASVGLTRYPAPSYTPSFRFDRHKPCYLNPPAARARPASGLDRRGFSRSARNRHRFEKRL